MQKNEKENAEELLDSWWFKVYVAVIVVAILTILALGLFSRYFA